MDPRVVEQLARSVLAGEDEFDFCTRRSDEDRKPTRLVHEFFAIVDRLEGQTGPEIAAVALEDAETADDVVEDFVAAAVASRVNARGVVLEVDPTGHDHRRGEDEIENFGIGIGGVVVVVKESATGEIQGPGAGARGDDDRGVVGEAPLGTDLRDVIAAGPDVVGEFGGRSRS